MNWVRIGSGNGLSPVRRQAIDWKPNLAYSQLSTWKQISVKFESEFYHFHSRKCIWNCRLPKWRPYCPGGRRVLCLHGIPAEHEVSRGLSRNIYPSTPYCHCPTKNKYLWLDCFNSSRLAEPKAAQVVTMEQSNLWHVFTKLRQAKLGLCHWGRASHHLNPSSPPGHNDHLFCRRQFKVHFLEWKWSIFDSNFTEICSQVFNWQHAITGPGNGLVPKRRQVNVDSVHWRVYAALGGDAL